MLTFPSRGRSWAVFFTRPFSDPADGSVLYPITTWTLAPTAWLREELADVTLLGFAGNVGQFTNVYTDNGTAYKFDYESGWLAFESPQWQDRIKILKRLHSIVFTLSATDVVYKWNFDFQDQYHYQTISYTALGAAEWGEAAEA